MAFWSRQIQIRKRIQIIAYNILEISIDLFGCQCAGGDERARTADPLLAKQVLSQLSYIPWDTARNRALCGASPAPPSACEEHGLRGRLSDLESLKSGKDRTKNHGPCLLGLLFALERTKRDGFSPRTEPPSASCLARFRAPGPMRSKTRSGRLLFAISLARSRAFD